MQRADDCSRLLEQRSQELKNKEGTLGEAGVDLQRQRAQQSQMERELEHQRAVESRLRGENTDLERRLDEECGRNNSLTAAVADLDAQIRNREDYIYALRQDAEDLRLQGAHLHE